MQCHGMQFYVMEPVWSVRSWMLDVQCLRCFRHAHPPCLLACAQDMAMLPSVVRLADYMVVSGSLDLLVTTVENLKVGGRG